MCYTAVVSDKKSESILPTKPNLRPVEVAKYLDVNVQTIYELIEQGIIPAMRMRRHYRIPREQFLEACRRHMLGAIEE